MISQGKTVNIPVRLDDDAFLLAENFSKMYNLQPAGQRALQEILEAHIQMCTQLKLQEASDSESLPFADSSDDDRGVDAKPTTIVEENPASTLDESQLPFQSQSMIATEDIGEQLEG